MAIGTKYLPSKLRKDKTISDFSKLLFIDLSVLCLKEGFCWISDKALIDEYGVSKMKIVRALRELKENNWIEIEHPSDRKLNGRRIIKISKKQGIKTDTLQDNQGIKTDTHKVSNMILSKVSNMIPNNLINIRDKEKENEKDNKECVVYSSLSLTETELQKLFNEFWQIYPNEKKNLDEKSAFEKFIQIDLEKEYQYLMSFIQNLIDTNKSKYIPNLKAFFQKQPFTNHSQIDCSSDFKIDSILHPITQQQIDNLFEQLKL